MEIELTCARCGATLDDRMEHGKVVVEPCECLTTDTREYPVGPDADEIRTIRAMWRSTGGWR